MVVHPACENRIAVNVLQHRFTAIIKPGEDEVEEVGENAEVEISRVEIKAAFDQFRIIGVLGAHPFPEHIAKLGPEQWNHEKEKHRKQAQDIFPNPPRQHCPVGVTGVVKRDPEERTKRDGEEKVEREEPRVGELDMVGRRADDGEKNSEKRQAREDRAQRITSRPEFLGRRNVDGMGMSAHGVREPTPKRDPPGKCSDWFT